MIRSLGVDMVNIILFIGFIGFNVSQVQDF